MTKLVDVIPQDSNEAPQRRSFAIRRLHNSFDELVQYIMQSGIEVLLDSAPQNNQLAQALLRAGFAGKYFAFCPNDSVYYSIHEMQDKPESIQAVRGGIGSTNGLSLTATSVIVTSSLETVLEVFTTPNDAVHVRYNDNASISEQLEAASNSVDRIHSISSVDNHSDELHGSSFVEEPLIKGKKPLYIYKNVLFKEEAQCAE